LVYAGNSNLSEQGLQYLSVGFPSLKELDISKSRFVGGGTKWLSGYKYVSLKLNEVEGLTQQAVLVLVATSYNLNYLELSHVPLLDCEKLLPALRDLYLTNALNFSRLLPRQSGCGWSATRARCCSSTSWHT
jgi:hypothetical protein